VKNLQLLSQCNKYASPSVSAIPSNCQGTFKEYDTNDKIQMNMNRLPLYKEEIMSQSRKKHLQQQLNDLNNLVTRFKSILDELLIGPNNLPNFDYDSIIQLNRENVQLRNDLDQKLGEIHEYNNSRIVNSKLQLDSSVYAGVLWSILATSLIYVMFTKL
jgi:hypothetical protein